MSVEEFKSLLWGPTLKEDVFKRWSQGTYIHLNNTQHAFFVSSFYAFVLMQLIASIVMDTWHVKVFFLSGFEFSETESTALVQWEGGPCAVLAPVQAFILKTLLLDVDPTKEQWRMVILLNCRLSRNSTYMLSFNYFRGTLVNAIGYWQVP